MIHLLKDVEVEIGLIFSHFKCSLSTINSKSRPSDCLSVMRAFHIQNSVYKFASNQNLADVNHFVNMLNTYAFCL